MAENDEPEGEEGSDFIFYKSGKTSAPEVKERAWMLLAEGKSLREIERRTGIARGTLSRWRRSPGYAKWFVDHGGSPHTPLLRKKRSGVRRKPVDEEREIRVRGKFMQAVSVGGVAWAQAFSGATDRESAKFLRELDVSGANATPRIRVLSEMLKIGLDKQVLPNIRIKALTDWWRLAENAIGPEALIHIDARMGDTSGPTPTQALIEGIRHHLGKHAHIPDISEIIDVEEVEDGADNDE